MTLESSSSHRKNFSLCPLEKAVPPHKPDHSWSLAKAVMTAYAPGRINLSIQCYSDNIWCASLLILLLSDRGQGHRKGRNSPVLSGLRLEILGRALSHLIILTCLDAPCLSAFLGLAEKRAHGLFSASVLSPGSAFCSRRLVLVPSEPWRDVFYNWKVLLYRTHHVFCVFVLTHPLKSLTS